MLKETQNKDNQGAKGPSDKALPIFSP